MKRFLAALSAVAIATAALLIAPTTAIAAPSDGIPCPLGTYSATGYSSVSEGVTCVSASPGTYVAYTGSTAALPCPPGYFQPTFGSINCLPAPAGRFVSVSGADQALPCPPGSYQANIASLACVPAEIGTYVDTSGAIATTGCPTGFTTAASGSIAASDCSISTAQAPAPTAPTPTVTPSPTPSPENTIQAEPTPIAMPVVMPAPMHKAQVALLGKLPASMKAGSKFTFSAKNPSGLAMRANVAGSCKISSNKTSFALTAANKAGACILRLTNAGNATYSPLATRYVIKVTR